MRSLLLLACVLTFSGLASLGCPPVGDGEGMGEGIGEGVGEGVGEGIGEGAGEGVGEGTGEGVGEGVGEGTGEGIGEGIGEGVGEGAGEGDGEGMGEGDPAQVLQGAWQRQLEMNGTLFIDTYTFNGNTFVVQFREQPAKKGEDFETFNYTGSFTVDSSFNPSRLTLNVSEAFVTTLSGQTPIETPLPGLWVFDREGDVLSLAFITAFDSSAFPMGLDDPAAMRVDIAPLNT